MNDGKSLLLLKDVMHAHALVHLPSCMHTCRSIFFWEVGGEGCLDFGALDYEKRSYVCNQSWKRLTETQAVKTREFQRSCWKHG